MKMMRVYSVFASVMVAYILFFHYSQSIEEQVDVASLQSTGDDWKIVVQDTLPDGGSIKLNHDQWLMYFLHWRPLTQERENISVEYARERMLNFWGPDMPFAITSEGGEAEIAGHKAYFIDGSFSNGAVQTRFIVWNCPGTKRQFIADCNINKRRGTRDSLLELQYEISSTISCHGEETVSTNPLLTRKYSSEEFNVSFFIPENWRTYAYTEPEWFPDGQSENNGSLWTLLTDSNRYIDLIWDEDKHRITEALFQECLDKFKNSVWDFEQVTYSMSDFKVDEARKVRNDFVGSGSYRINYRYQEQQGGEIFLYRAYLRNYRNKTYFLMASIISRATWWNRLVDLTPTDDVFDNFLKDEVFPNVSAFRRGMIID